MAGTVWTRGALVWGGLRLSFQHDSCLPLKAKVWELARFLPPPPLPRCPAPRCSPKNSRGELSAQAQEPSSGNDAKYVPRGAPGCRARQEKQRGLTGGRHWCERGRAQRLQHPRAPHPHPPDPHGASFGGSRPSPAPGGARSGPDLFPICLPAAVSEKEAGSGRRARLKNSRGDMGAAGLTWLLSLSLPLLLLFSCFSPFHEHSPGLVGLRAPGMPRLGDGAGWRRGWGRLRGRRPPRVWGTLDGRRRAGTWRRGQHLAAGMLPALLRACPALPRAALPHPPPGCSSPPPKKTLSGEPNCFQMLFSLLTFIFIFFFRGFHIFFVKFVSLLLQTCPSFPPASVFL